jgi:hypothetical protein
LIRELKQSVSRPALPASVVMELILIDNIVGYVSILGGTLFAMPWIVLRLLIDEMAFIHAV